MGVVWSIWSKQEEDDDDFSDDSSFSEEENEKTDQNLTNIHIQEDLQSALDLSDNNCLDSATDTVDASPPTTTMSITLSLNQVLDIENQLDLYEKVSIVYLLYDQASVAVEHLSTLIEGGQDKLLYNWAIHQNLLGLKWQEKFIEALCIIQNYQVLRGLGLDRQDLNLRFLPQHSFTCVHVNKFRRALYFICENLIQSDVTHLLNLVFGDFVVKHLSVKVFNPPNLEMYFLHWEAEGYIKSNDLGNLFKILKQMDQLDLCEKLKELIPTVSPAQNVHNVRLERNLVKDRTGPASINENVNKKPPNVIEGILNQISLVDMVSMESPISADNAPFVSDANKYDVDVDNPGICLIINQENFYRDIDDKVQHLLPPFENKLELRLGTRHDREKLEATFRQFGFKTETADNLTHVDVVRKIDEVVQKVTNESSLFVCIMSHGDEGVVYGVNSCQITVKSIQKLMCTRNRQNLSGKPKILILQSCQGSRCQRISLPDDEDDIATDGPSSPDREVVPRWADVFTFWATVPGYGAIRNKKTGSWFIQSLCENMTELGNTYHFEDICTSVIRDVSSKKWHQVNDDVAMVPLKDSTLRKLFYLPPIRS